jgi:dTMP kinase
VSRFITFEGPDGSGKTTQVALLAEALQQQGRKVVRTREPGGTAISEQIRALLHDTQNTAMLPVTEILLYSAARAQHVGQIVRPALARGEVVISDRFAESTIAYQGYGRGLDLAMLEQITVFATGGLHPDLVVYLDVEAAVGLERRLRDTRAGRGEWNRMDQEQVAFHQRVRAGYVQMAAQQGGRWLVLDATQPIATLHEMILARVVALLGDEGR